MRGPQSRAERWIALVAAAALALLVAYELGIQHGRELEAEDRAYAAVMGGRSR